MKKLVKKQKHELDETDLLPLGMIRRRRQKKERKPINQIRETHNHFVVLRNNETGIPAETLAETDPRMNATTTTCTRASTWKPSACFEEFQVLLKGEVRKRDSTRSERADEGKKRRGSEPL